MFNKNTKRLHFVLYPQFTEVDHIDRNKLNNKLENLRYVSLSENGFNKNIRLKRNKNKNDEYYNIYKNKRIHKDILYEYFFVVIKQKCYGSFKNINDAIKKRDEIIKGHIVYNSKSYKEEKYREREKEGT